MMIIDGTKLDFDDVLIVPQRSEQESRSNISLERTFVSKHGKIFFRAVPIIAANMSATGTIPMAKALSQHGMMTALHKYIDSELVREYIEDDFEALSMHAFTTIGEGNKELDRIRKMYIDTNIPLNPSVDYKYLINIDVANGYRSSFAKFISQVRDVFGNDAVIMAGNVCTPEMVTELILSGADIVKVGIGPGSVCKTRKVTGVGYPMISCIMECANAAHNEKALVCADGGCKTSGDIAKAFCAGADFVMLGGMLAGTDECEGEWLGENNRRLKFFGMSSIEAMEKFGGAEKNYRASEGECIEVPYKGPVDAVVKEILGGLRSTATYIGADNIKDFHRRGNFVRVIK